MSLIKSYVTTAISNARATLVTGVKGNAESSYRTGQVNITPANVGAVNKAGDTMTGKLTLVANQYGDALTSAALDLQNSNIVGVNSIYTADLSDNAQEGIHFFRDSSHFDTLFAKNGALFFTPYRALNSNGTPAEVLTRSGMMRSIEMLTTNPFAPPSLRGPYISKIDNAFYAADKRWTVSAVKSGGGGNADVSWLFNGSYENAYQCQNGNTATITIDFTGSGTRYGDIEIFPGYPYGYILLSFYYTDVPASVTGRVYCNYASQGVGWHDITFSPMYDNGTTQCTYRGYNTYYAISKLEITITARDSGVTGCSQIEMHLDRPDPNKNPFLSKYAAEELYYPLTLRGGLKFDSETSLPGLTNPSYFLTMDAFASGGRIRYTGGNYAANSLLNALSTGSSDPQDADYYISQYVGGGTTTTSYHRRPMSALWNYIKTKIGSWAKNNTGSAQSLGWSSVTNDVMPVTSNTIAYWNGAYQGTNSNLAYCNKGAFGTFATKNSLAASDIPNLDASKVTGGTLDKARLPDASTSAKGAVQLSSATNSDSETLAATPKAVKAAYTKATDAFDEAGRALSAATGALVLKVTYSISGGSVTAAAHVYSAGAEVTESYDANLFSWSMSINGGTSWTSIGTGRTVAVPAMTAFGGSVKCDFTPPDPS